MSSGCRSGMPNSRAVASPSWRIFSQSSERTFSTISSMRAGWMRPSTMSFSRASRATSRRSGSKAEMTIASGVSSMIRSTPVAASRARMLRPSRPMMRPFRSSEGSSTTETVASTTVSDASRWMAMPMIRRAFWVACSVASSSIRRIRPAASSRASFSTDLTRSRLASTAVSPEICSRRLRWSSMTCWISASLSSSFFCWSRDVLLLPAELLFAPLLLGELPVQVLFLLLDPLLQGGDLLPAGLDGLVELDAGGEDLLLGLDVRLADLGVSLAARFGQRLVGLRPDARALALDLLPQEEEADGEQDRGQDRSRRDRDRESCVHFGPPKRPGARQTGVATR